MADSTVQVNTVFMVVLPKLYIAEQVDKEVQPAASPTEGQEYHAEFLERVNRQATRPTALTKTTTNGMLRDESTSTSNSSSSSSSSS